MYRGESKEILWGEASLKFFAHIKRDRGCPDPFRLVI